MSEKLPSLLIACLSTGAVVAGMVGYMLMPPIASQVIAAAFTGPAPTRGAPTQGTPHPEIPRIQAEETKQLANALLLDVRSQGEYEAGHIRGAVWAPFEKIDLQAATLPKGRPLVLYCT